MSDLPTILESTAQRSPQRIAIQTEASLTTYAELRDLVQLTEHRLRQAGIMQGHRVALLFLNAPPCVMAFLALARLGTHVILLNHETTADDLQMLIGEIGAVPVLCPGSLVGRFNHGLAPPTRVLLDIDALLAEGSCSALNTDAGVPAPAGQVYVYHCSSGTTGRPKVIIQSQQNLISGAQLYCATYGITSDDALLVAVPLSHSFGLVAGLAAALLAGARLLLLERFVPAEVLQLLEREGISLVIGTPRVYELLLNPNLPLPAHLPMLRVALSSGSPVPLALSEHFARRFGIPICEVYGSTETGIIAAQWPRAGGWPAGSVGQPLDGVHIRIIEGSGSDVAVGGTGQLIVQTPAMFLGYLNNPPAGADALLQQWYQTGDLAWRNSDGDLFLVGRNPLLIRHGGATINPLEVESVLLSHPQVHEALVYANEALCAAVVVEGEVTSDALLALCRIHLAPFKVPESIIFVSELPKGELGKLRRIVSGIRSI